MVLKIPGDAKTYELSNSVIWFDKDNIMYSLPKPGQHEERSRSEISEEMKRLKEILPSPKVCMILESGGSNKPPKREDREFISQQITSITRAMAIITTSAVSKMVANLFFTFKPPQYPMKMFSTEEAAKNWIRQYL